MCARRRRENEAISMVKYSFYSDFMRRRRENFAISRCKNMIFWTIFGAAGENFYNIKTPPEKFVRFWKEWNPGHVFEKSNFQNNKTPAKNPGILSLRGGLKLIPR